MKFVQYNWGALHLLVGLMPAWFCRLRSFIADRGYLGIGYLGIGYLAGRLISDKHNYMLTVSSFNV